MKAFSLRKVFFLTLFLIPLLAYSQNKQCRIPGNIRTLIVKQGSTALKSYPDILRNYSALKNLCISLLSFKEGRYKWDMLLVTHPKANRGAFWFLPHDNENSAFDAAVYAVQRYGGGFLSVVSGGRRYHEGQDPNRNFSSSTHKVASCRYQKQASPRYTKYIFSIINTYRAPGMPYLALHNNTNGGGVSILRSSKSVRSFLAHPREKVKHGRGLMDEDSLVYTAGRASSPSKRKLKALLRHGINVKYEHVSASNNDCSMSNYVVLGKGSNNYYNIETQHGDSRTQKRMIDILMEKIMR